ncbi:hypothetical protein B4Q13_15135, partial [Lacticaseibacillus rhamnosus]
MFAKVLIANRGEIAVRIMRACEELGIATVAVYSELDRDAIHVKRADEAFLLGPGPASESYLNIDKLLEAVKELGPHFLDESTVKMWRVLAALPTWFGIPESVEDYVAKADEHPTVVATVDRDDLGILTLVLHTPYAAEVYVMGVRPEHHRHGIGRQMLAV